jgi:hypothetical protein
MAKPTFVRAGQGTATGTTGTLAFDATDGDCLYVLSGVNTAAGTDAGGVTYNGVAMTQVGASDLGGQDFRLWRLVAPATGSNNIVVTLSPANSRNINIQAVLLAGVYATTPEQTAVTDTDLSVAAGTITADQLVLACAVVLDNSQPGGAQFSSTGTSQTDRIDSDGTNPIYQSMATQAAEGAVTSTFTYAATTDDEGIITVAVNGVDPVGVTQALPAANRQSPRGRSNLGAIA